MPFRLVQRQILVLLDEFLVLRCDFPKLEHYNLASALTTTLISPDLAQSADRVANALCYECLSAFGGVLGTTLRSNGHKRKLL